MKHMITFWKNSGNPVLRGKTVELFLVSWDEDLGEWVKDEEGKYWGMYKFESAAQEVRRLNKNPEELGLVEDFYEEDSEPETFKLQANFKGEVWEDIQDEIKVNRAPGVDSLEAKDVTVEPTGLDLGEEDEQ